MANFFKSIKDYLTASIAELKKVTWPTKKQTINYTLVVIGLSVGMALFFTLVDYIFNFVIKFII